jgi:hypothetical protein
MRGTTTRNAQLECEGLEARNLEVLGQVKMDAQQDREHFILPSLFCSIQTRFRLAMHIDKVGSSLPSLLHLVQTSCRNTPTDTPRNSVLPVIWTFFRLFTLTHKSNHHTAYFLDLIFIFELFNTVCHFFCGKSWSCLLSKLNTTAKNEKEIQFYYLMDYSCLIFKLIQMCNKSLDWFIKLHIYLECEYCVLFFINMKTEPLKQW